MLSIGNLKVINCKLFMDNRLIMSDQILIFIKNLLTNGKKKLSAKCKIWLKLIYCKVINK